ncbi:NmrA/HSCARG family protein [Micromonospora sp. NPDC049230]|uniref:NmrA/HSCARG family protein n=1 Tax=Micromonospora sp. NPDC049230 TaxID=3155502 RepID=UPI0033EB2DEA
MLTVAVGGATGAQGGATARALLKAGHRVRALTRRPDSPAADTLRNLGADVRQADFDDQASLDAALAGADSLFAVTTPFGTDRATQPGADPAVEARQGAGRAVEARHGAGLATEVRQGRVLVDAAAAAGLGHIVLTTVAHADRGTGVPHYESKYLVEQHLRGSGVPWTIIAPAAFMDNYASGWTLDGLRHSTFAWPMPADRPFALIPAVDIGAFAALVLRQPGQFVGRRIDIASDQRTPAQLAEILAGVIGRAIDHQRVPLARVRQWSGDLAAMFEYFTDVGLDVDVEGLRRDYPEVGWHGFADWAAAQDWATLLSATPASHAPTTS